jgi:5-methylcytosine-specific restriction endonuclease McrA
VTLRSALQRWRDNRSDARAARRNRSDGTTCFYCGIGFGPEGSSQRTVDHRVPRAAGGTDGLINVVFACRACNERKADGTEAALRSSAWLARRRLEVADRPDGPPRT